MSVYKKCIKESKFMSQMQDQNCGGIITSTDNDGSTSSSSSGTDYISPCPLDVRLEIFKYLSLRDIRQPVCKWWLEASKNCHLWQNIKIEKKTIRIRHLKAMASGVKNLQLVDSKVLLSCNWNGFATTRFNELQRLHLIRSEINPNIFAKLASKVRVLELRGKSAYDMDSFTGIFSTVLKLKHLEELILSHLELTDSFVENCRNFHKLRSVTLRYCGFSGGSMNSLEKFARFNQLIHLICSGFYWITDENFSMLTKMEHLEKLHLELLGSDKFIKRCDAFQSLQELNLHMDYGHRPALQQILSCCSQVTSLVLSGYGIIINDETFKEVLKNQKLHNLKLGVDSYIRITNHPNAMQQQSNIRRLDLHRCCFRGSKSLRNFLLHCKQVVYFQLGGISIRPYDADFRAIAEMTYLQKLTVKLNTKLTIERICDIVQNCPKGCVHNIPEKFQKRKMK